MFKIYESLFIQTDLNYLTFLVAPFVHSFDCIINFTLAIKADAGTYSYDPQKIHAVTGIEPSAGSAIATPDQNITYTAFK